MTLNTTWAVEWLSRAAEEIAAAAPMLGELDRAIGDGDHGENMNRGFSAVRAALPELAGDATPSDVLRMAAVKLISSVGGAAGPLYGTALLRASDAVKGLDRLAPVDVVALLGAALGGIQERGHAAEGDKTMVDAWSSAVQAARTAESGGSDVSGVLAAAADGADSGASGTEAMVAHKGRASYLGERAIGHRDPGAASTAIILRAALEAAS